MTEITATELRSQAAAHRAEAAASFDRCDTDGFVSQWANGLSAQEKSLQAEITENGGVSGFPALFDLDGNLVAAKLITTQYGTSWGILASDDPRSRIVKWVNRSYASKAATRNRNMMKKGYTEGTVMAPARATITGSGTGLAGAASCYVTAYRTDGGFSRDVTVVRTDEVGDF